MTQVEEARTRPPRTRRVVTADDPLAGQAHPFCGVAAAAALLGDAWTLLLLRDLAHGPRRFKELETSTGISPRVLTDRLRALVERGMMTRKMYPEIPPRVEYELTEEGHDALPVLDVLRSYGEKWLHPGFGEACAPAYAGTEPGRSESVA